MMPENVQHDLLCDMPFTFDDFGAVSIADERIAAASLQLWDVSPPESPCYSTSLSDSSTDEIMRSLDGPIDFRTIIERTKEESSEVMWGNHTTDFFLASSAASWAPTSPSDEDLSDFNLASFGLDEHSVESFAVPVTEATEAASVKRKLAETTPAAADCRPAKKARVETPASPVAREDPECKRHTHNVLERKRRNDLKQSYHLLRQQIPGLAENERAPTGQILLHAVECINALQTEEQQLLEDIAKMRAENDRLRREMC